MSSVPNVSISIEETGIPSEGLEELDRFTVKTDVPEIPPSVPFQPPARGHTRWEIRGLPHIPIPPSPRGHPSTRETNVENSKDSNKRNPGDQVVVGAGETGIVGTPGIPPQG